MIFFQGDYPPEVAARYPGKSMPALYKLPGAEAQVMADEIARYASMSGQSMIIEDTYPAPVAWPSALQRILIVRPSLMKHMRFLNEKYARELKSFIVCDHPESPSWPYSPEETSEMSAWKKWKFLGPLFRSPTPQGIKKVSQRYQLAAGQKLFVFTLGAGGEKPGSGDRNNFLQKAALIATELQQKLHQPRLIFICGPLFPAELEIPPFFEVVREELELPSLFGVADGVVLRPGYNSLWECIAAGVPFLPILGATYLEPSRQRILALRAFGLNFVNSMDCWLDAEWIRNYKQTCRYILSRFSGTPETEMVDSLSYEPEALKEEYSWNPKAGAGQASGIFHELTSQLRGTIAPKELLIRLDDVIEMGPALEWLAALCRERNLFASLEVIPYLSQINERTLDNLDKDGLLEVSQHGCAHVPQVAVSGKGEFMAEPEPSPASLTLLRKGFYRLRRLFPRRFKGGYSPPYDGLPLWFPASWKKLGGQYISKIWGTLDPKQIANVRMPLETWNWQEGTQKPPAVIASMTLRAIQTDGRAGVVLHPQLLAIPSHRRMIERLIRALIEGGCISRSVSGAAGIVSPS